MTDGVTEDGNDAPTYWTASHFALLTNSLSNDKIMKDKTSGHVAQMGREKKRIGGWV